MTERSLAIVFGYVPNVDRLHKIAHAAGLTRRVAVALDTYRSDRSAEGMYFDDQLAVLLLAALCRQVPHDRIEIGSQDNSGIRRTWNTLPEWHSYYRNLAEDEREPFDDVKLFVGNTLTGFVQTDNWTACGGPHPYHDTWTFSVYLASYDRESLQGILLATCVEHDAFVRDILTGVEEPFISLTSRVWNWIR